MFLAFDPNWRLVDIWVFDDNWAGHSWFNEWLSCNLLPASRWDRPAGSDRYRKSTNRRQSVGGARWVGVLKCSTLDPSKDGWTAAEWVATWPPWIASSPLSIPIIATDGVRAARRQRTHPTVRWRTRVSRSNWPAPGPSNDLGRGGNRTIVTTRIIKFMLRYAIL